MHCNDREVGSGGLWRGRSRGPLRCEWRRPRTRIEALATDWQAIAVLYHPSLRYLASTHPRQTFGARQPSLDSTARPRVDARASCQ